MHAYLHIPVILYIIYGYYLCTFSRAVFFEVNFVRMILFTTWRFALSSVSVYDVEVLDWSTDPDHHRAVITFIGSPHVCYFN